MIGTRKLGKPNSEGEVLFGITTENTNEETAITEITDQEEENVTTTENDVAKTATSENTDGDKTSSDNVTSFNLDVNDNPYILTPPLIQSLRFIL